MEEREEKDRHGPLPCEIYELSVFLGPPATPERMASRPSQRQLCDPKRRPGKPEEGPELGTGRPPSWGTVWAAVLVGMGIEVVGLLLSHTRHVT